MQRLVLIPVLIAVAIAGCADSPVFRAGVDDRAEPAPGAESRRDAATASPAVVALLADAQQHGLAGDADKAAASLERALRIEPDNPWIWHRLAVLRLQQQRWSEAIALAQKSNALAGDQRRLLGGNWELIARAEEGRGNREAAAAARAKSREFAQSRG